MTEYWWRAYDNCVDHAKLILLSDRAHRAWFNLMCVASAHDGILPDIKIVAVKLRLTPARAASAIAELVSAGLFDRRDDGRYQPHNWDRRQFKTDAKDPSGAARSRKYRDNKKRDASRDDDRDASRDDTVSPERPHYTHHTDDDPDDARARPKSIVSDEARDLADELLVIAGHKLDFVPPGWCGAAMRVQAWLAEWPREVILIGVKAAAARKKGHPAASVDYFQNAVAEEFARQTAPLPKVEIREAQKLTVTNYGTPQTNRSGGSLVSELKRDLAELERPEGSDHQVPNSSFLRISG
jgi:hypothetical protein